MSSVTNLINRLNDSNLVAKVQAYFGLQLYKVVANETNNDQEASSKKKLFKINMLDDQKCLYSINNPLFYWFFLVTTHLGNEIFYILFLPLLCWNYDDKIMYLTCVSWALTMYIGQATKDILKIPRPLTPPVVKLEVKYLLEYGFPSTHAMAAMSISYSMLSFMPPSQVTMEIRLTAFLAVFFICLSRVYLGMHSFFDILGGLLYSYVLSFLFATLADSFYWFTDSNLMNGLLAYSACFLLCLAYPGKERWSSARSDTFLIMGAGAGLMIGMSLKSAYQMHHIGKLVNSFSWLLILKRSLVGVFSILLVRQISKIVLHKFIRYIYSLLRPSETITDIKKVIRSNFLLDVLFYFVSYSNISFAAVFIAFFVFDYLQFV